MPALAHTSTDHDETLIARLAADDLTGREVGEARALVATCPACAGLETDLRSIMAATAGLPAPRRTRDFRLTDADAARLRRTGWRRLLGRFGEPRLAFTRPLATGLVALGIAGLVFSSAPALLGSAGTAASVPAQAPVSGALSASQASDGSDSTIYGPESGPGAAGGAGGASAPSGDLASIAPLPPEPSVAASAVAIRSSAAPSTVPADAGSPASPPANFGNGGGVAASSGAPAPVLDQNPGVGKSAGEPAGAPAGSTPLFLVSAALLLIGAGIFVARWVARRAT